ncbi:unnamed protein product, partial [Ostreobium quekettii]
GEPTDLLFILTERHKICVLQYDAATGELVTKANGDVGDKIGRAATNGPIGIIDPECRLIGLHLYDGLLKVIPISGTTQFQEAFNVRLEELHVLDLCFMEGYPRPTIAVMYEDTKNARHIRTYEINIKEKDLQEGPWSQNNIDNGAEMMIPVPKATGGVIVLGESMITYFGTGAQPHKTIAVQETTFRAYGRIDEDGSRYLLGDYLGRMYLLVLAHDGENVLGLKLQQLGRTPAASSLSYLDSGVVFVGSRFGDSQLVKLHSAPVNGSPDNYIELLDTFTNLGPIIDFCVVDLDRQGQCQVVTCSGTFLEGSLRIIRSGIGITEQATIELPGIKGLWSLKKTIEDEYDMFLVLTFVNETRILAINDDEELDEACIPGFDSDAQTLYCGNVIHGQLLQVTRSSARLVSTEDMEIKGEWTAPAGFIINMATSSPSQVLLAGGQGRSVYLEIVAGGLKEVGQVTVPSEVSCVDITPIGCDPNQAQLAAIGSWDMSCSVYSLPSLTLLSKQELSSEVIPRSVLFGNFDGSAFLLCAMGDGGLFTWRVDPENGDLSDRKKMTLGTKPVTLTRFRSKGTSHVFAASDRPTIIYNANRKLLYSNLNENDVNFLASFNCASFPDSLAIAKEGSMTIGSIDEIQKLHIRKVPLREQPRRICHQPVTKTFGVCVEAMGEKPTSYFRIFDDETFEVEDSITLDANETGCQVASIKFADDPTAYFVVGTAYVLPDEKEPSRGRILVVLCEEGKLQIVAEKEMKGAVFTLNPIQGKLLATVNCKVHVLEWRLGEDQQRELVSTCSHHGHIMALYAAARGDFIIIGDIMRSMSLLLYKPEEGDLEERARDYNPNWMTSVAVLDDDVYLGAENSNNIFTVRRNSDSAIEEEQSRLEVVGEYHLGEFVNRFQHGSLVMKLADTELADVPTVLYATVNGQVGVIASLPEGLYLFLEKLQEALRKVIKGVGALDHKSYRMFQNERRTVDAHHFVDGDLIEMFLDLKREKMDEVAALIGEVSTEDVCKTVEELSRLH